MADLDKSSNEFRLNELLEQRQYHDLERRICELRSKFSSTNAVVQLELSEAAHRLCCACRDIPSQSNCENCAQRLRWQQDTLHKQLHSLLTALNSVTVPGEFDVLAVAGPSDRRDRWKGTISAIARRCRRVSKHIAHPVTDTFSRSDRLQVQIGELPLQTRRSNFSGGSGPSHPARQSSSPTVQTGNHSMQIYMLGPFRACVDGMFVRHWPNTKSRKIFQYLAFHHDQAVLKEHLMELFWPESIPDAARNSLNVAVYGLRKLLRNADPDFAYIVYQVITHPLAKVGIF